MSEVDAFCTMDFMVKTQNSGGGLVIFTIYRHPSDFPKHYVVRGAIDVLEANVQAALLFACLCDTLEEARQSLPWPMTWIGRDDDDEPQIVESWL